MLRSFRYAYALFVHATIMALLLVGCRSQEAPFSPDAAFTPYIPAFTAGHISARSPILVRIAEGYTLKDTSTAAIQQLFSLSPEVDGTVRWEDERTLAFRPQQRLDQEKTYTVSFRLSDLIEVPAGKETFKFQVTTVRQGIDARVSDLRSIATNDLSWQRLVVAVHTSDDATGQDLETCFKAAQEGRPLRLNWEHEPNGHHHLFTVDSVRRGETASDVVIEWDGGKIASEDKGALVFTVPSIGTLALIAADTDADGEQRATLLFSDPLDPEQDLSGLVGIAGAEDVRVSVEGNKLLLYPTERLQGEQQAYVAAAVRNVHARPLGRDLTVDLRFEELRPAVRLVGKGSILPSSDGLVMPFEAVNLKAVDVRVVRIQETNIAQFLQVNALDGQRELARVGRLITHRTIPLLTSDAPDLGRWNRFYLDLEQHIKAEPGAIYRVELSFSREHSNLPCTDTEEEELEPERTWEEEQAAYDHFDAYWYYDDHGYEEYDHEQREDPCSPSYYARNNAVARNILASDLGLIAKCGNDGSVLIAVSDLRSTEPMSGVNVEVLDLQRKSLGKVVTDRAGLARLPSTRHKPSLLVASKGTQRGYLPLGDGASLSVSEFDVQGAAIERGLKGYLYGERGVWRPGDSLYLAFMLNDALNKLPKDHPVVLELTDPLGRLVQKHVRTTAVNGIYAFRCATSAQAPTGTWNARVIVGGTSFHKSLRIETVKPNRLKIQLDVGERIVDGAQEVGLRANWLHGAPARGLKSRVTVTMTSGKASFKGYEPFTFDDLRTQLPEEEQVVFDGSLNDTGQARFPLALQAGRSAPAVVLTNIVTRVFEAGGDASMDRTTTEYLPYASYVGIKAPTTYNAWGGLVTDTTYTLPVVAVDAHGKSLSGHKLNAQVYKLKYNWWWDGDLEGDANYISSPSVELVEGSELVTDAKGRTSFKFRVNRPEWGRFAVRVTDPASGHSSALQFHLDWPGWEGRSRREEPDQAAMLNFNSDRTKYNVGDQATLIIPSSGSGRALISLESGSRIVDATWVELKDKETRHTFQVTAAMAPNVYAHVSVVQPHARTMNDLPIRLYGVIPIMVEDATTHLEPVIAMTKEIKTDVPFEVEVGEQEGRAMSYTLAIVDEGLLDLTRFKTPDPWKHFHAKEALGVRTWDVYDQVIGAFGRQLARVLALGGSDDAGPAENAKADRFKPVVKYVGPFHLERGRKAKHRFTINNYVGSVRVMLVASDGEKAYGHAEKAVPVKKPLMVLATLPRVLAPGERADLPVTVFAMDPKVKDVKVKLELNDRLIVDGPGEKTIRFNAVGDQVVRFGVRVKESIGVAKVKVTVSGAGETAAETIELDVRQANSPMTDVTETYLEPGKTWQGSGTPMGIAGTNSAYIELSTIPPVDFGRRLQYLIDYPHGCLEQTTSKAFPQLYIAKVMDLPARTEQAMRGHVDAALRLLGQFQRTDGGFNYWPGAGDHYDDWTSIYAGHFMVEAQREGYRTVGNTMANWLAYQRRTAREWQSVRRDGWSNEATQLTQAYRLYTLALAKQPELGAMNRLREQRDLTLMGRWMLAAAYALTGQKTAAQRLVDGIPDAMRAYTEQGCTYGSDLRDDALIAETLMLLGETAKAAGVIQRIAKNLSSDGWYSTQSTAFGLLATAHFTQQDKLQKGISYKLVVAGKATDKFTEKAVSRIDLPNPDGKAQAAITNTGRSGIHLRHVRVGTPPVGEERPTAHGLVMDVTYTDMQGRTIDPARIEQGTDLMAVVRLAHLGVGGELQHLALTQVFPSGWEIRNNRMEGTESASQTSSFTYQDIRDDRVLTYFDLWRGNPVTYRVMLNAAYTGRYYLPGAHCEAMYDHTVNARSSGRWVEVVSAGDLASAER
jgi:hypothetical protein